MWANRPGVASRLDARLDPGSALVIDKPHVGVHERLELVHAAQHRSELELHGRRFLVEVDAPSVHAERKPCSSLLYPLLSPRPASQLHVRMARRMLSGRATRPR